MSHPQPQRGIEALDVLRAADVLNEASADAAREIITSLPSDEAAGLLGQLSRWIRRPFWAFSTEVVPRLLGRIQGHQFSGPYFDMGTPESLVAARAAAGGVS